MIGKNIMSLFPDKNLIIVTSALKSTIGVLSERDRFEQTLLSLVSLRKVFLNDIILFADGSADEIEKEKLDEIGKLVNAIICWNKDPEVGGFARRGMKSEAETAMMFKMLVAIKRDPELSRLLTQVKRVFKISARTFLHQTFDLKEYDNHFGKYIFKKAVPSWLPPQYQRITTDHLYITRLFSFCPSLIDDYIHCLTDIYQCQEKYNIDTEHSHYKVIDRKYVVEFEKIHCEGIMASTGKTEIY